ncbi:GMC family oxidoreductase [Mycobacterium sp. 1423905.2]|uniref:GMC family oxidoreductase n=1 Tax=Mycobacterium sp. 1423905.2 TaxID=1856859 RepID=UPI000800D49C|nr:GMC family oxidoreductase N-terminal domain-containing protein [Mycobacterium sp. 1423905.2]OBJ62713.1 choline dehydrogenase [Mycobacterium sp. 1423905.2]
MKSDVTDYIVVGAGSAGSVVVRRLLDAGHSVRVIEAGPADTDPAIHCPQDWPALFGGPHDWAMFTTPQPNANSRKLFWPRGKVLGGSSSLNGMIYIRGHASDYEQWAHATGDSGWDWDNVLSLFKRSESHELGANEFHGADGPLPVSTIVTPHPVSEAFVEAALATGHKVVDDFNAGDMVGVGYNHITALHGERMSAWKSFVAPILHHPRLRITTDALVHRVLLENGSAVGVEYSDGGRPPCRAYADAEVVLSAGVVGSPKVLLLSGIGPGAHLESVGVTPEVDLPAVGQNLHDHLLVSNIYAAKDPLPPGTNNLLEAQLFARSGGCKGEAPDLQPLFIHIPYPADGYPMPEHGYTIAAGLVNVQSRGTLRLASADPSDAPLVDPNVLADQADLEAVVDAVELCREIGASAVFAPWRASEVAPGPMAITRDDLRRFVRQAVGTYHHQVGTCRMGARSDPNAVVGPDLQVRGIDNLRVADASIMPTITTGNTNAPSIMIGERAADLLLAG